MSHRDARRYLLHQPELYTPPESHRALGDRDYVAPSDDELDTLEVNDVIEVLDWNYEDGDRDFIPR